MRIFAVLIGAILFFVLFFFAVYNSASVELRMLGGFSWQAPLVMFLLGAFLCGVLVGLLAMLPSWVRLRLKVNRLNDNLRLAKNAPLSKSSKSSSGPDTITSVAQGARTTS
jgi:lipopolysaccharide assembly protein A